MVVRKSLINLKLILIEFVGNIDEYKVNQIILNKDNVLKESVSNQGAYILIPKTGIGNYQNFQEFLRQQIAN